jgi:hypothetical protein
MANRALYIKSLLPVAERMVETAEGEARPHWQAFAEEGRRHEHIYTALAHQQDDGFGAMIMSGFDTQGLRMIRTRTTGRRSPFVRCPS